MGQRPMPNQHSDEYTLFSGTPPHSDNDTSLAAAESMRPHVSRLARSVFTEIAACGEYGATCWEIEQRLSMSHQTASARIRELFLKGRITKSGKKRPTNSRRLAVVWIENRRAQP